MNDMPQPERPDRAKGDSLPALTAPMPDSPADDTTRTATVIIATVMMGVVVWWLREILAPLALALFLMLVIDGFSRVLSHRIPRFPKRAALPLALILTILAFGLSVYIVADNAGRFLAQLIADTPKFNGLIARIAGQEG